MKALKYLEFLYKDTNNYDYAGFLLLVIRRKEEEINTVFYS